MSVDLTNPEFGFQVGHAARIHRDMMGSQGPQCIELMCRVLVADNDDIEEVRLAYLRLFERAPELLAMLKRLVSPVGDANRAAGQFEIYKEMFLLVAEIENKTPLALMSEIEEAPDPTQPSPYSA